jgi:hypothetical protein
MSYRTRRKVYDAQDSGKTASSAGGGRMVNAAAGVLEHGG